MGAPVKTIAKGSTSALEVSNRIVSAVNRVIRGKDEVIRLLVTALVARGHVLIEDVPGVGKTTISRALAAAVGGTFRRIQFTSDLLPSDIIGVSVYDQETNSFEFKRGPIFANVVLADEINRTTPRTQSSLMEALNEGQVSVDSQTYQLEDPFLVLATQNPVEHFGTYPLPESQMDRFILRLTIGYPAPADELRVIRERGGYDSVAEIEPVVTPQEVIELQRVVDDVRVDESLSRYLLAIVEETRKSPLLTLGVSTRGAIAWYRCTQAYALLSGRDHVLPDDVKQLTKPCLAHRVMVEATRDGITALSQAEQVLDEILDRIPVPV